MGIIKNFKGFLLCFAEMLIGVLLFINPSDFTQAVIICLGIALIVAGVFKTVQYFKEEAEDASENYFLLKGLTLIFAGVVCCFNSNGFSEFAVIYGMGMFVSSFAKLQWGTDLLRFKNKKWFFAVISFAVSLICAVLILVYPFKNVEIVWKFTGISFVVQAVIDILALTVSAKERKKDNEK